LSIPAVSTTLDQTVKNFLQLDFPAVHVDLPGRTLSVASLLTP
jgi:hypothetical protein